MLTREGQGKKGKTPGPAVSLLPEEAFDLLGMGVIHLSSDFLVLHTNSRAAAILGKPVHELVGRPLDSVTPDALARRVSEMCTQALTHRTAGYCEVPRGGKDGGWLACRCLSRGRGFSLLLEDVTARKEADEKTLLRERRLRTELERVYDSVPVGMCVLDRDMRYARINEYLARLNGLPQADHIGRSVRDVIPGIADRIEPIARAVIESGKPEFGVRIEGSPESPGKPGRSWITHWIPLTDDTGKQVGVNMVLQNITELKEALKALRESEERYRLLHDTLVQGVIEFDEENRVVSANPAAEEITGLDERRMYGKEFRDLISLISGIYCEGEPSCERTVDRLQALKTGKPFRNQIIRFHHQQSGQERWVSMDSIPRFRSGRKRPSGAFVIFSDITELRRARELIRGKDRELEKRMKHDIARLATAVEQAGEGIMLLSPRLVIEYVNPAFEKISGYTRSELIGKGIDSLSDYFLGDVYTDIVHQIGKTGKAWTGRRRRRRKSGEAIEVSLTLSPIRDDTGALISYVSVVRDITYEARLNQQLAEVQKMEAIGKLAGGIAHDLKNIFTPIVLNTETALSDLDEGSPIRPMLEESRHAALLGNEMVKQIVTFSRRHIQGKQPVDLSPIVSEAVAFLRSALPGNVHIRQRIGSGRFTALADPVQIKQVLINLGDNAGYAMREKGGILDVSLGRTSLDERDAALISPELAPGSYIRIKVRDTGEGMDEKTLQRAFEPFFTTKKHPDGTGMGLAIVRGIVRDHLGDVVAQSRPNKGTTFFILIPELRQRAGRRAADA